MARSSCSSFKAHYECTWVYVRPVITAGMTTRKGVKVVVSEPDHMVAINVFLQTKHQHHLHLSEGVGLFILVINKGYAWSLNNDEALKCLSSLHKACAVVPNTYEVAYLQGFNILTGTTCTVYVIACDWGDSRRCWLFLYWGILRNWYFILTTYASSEDSRIDH